MITTIGNKLGIPVRRENWLGPRFEPSNVSSTATMRDVQNAVRQAENGDPTLLFRFYRDILLGDDHIATELDKRKLAVLGQPLSILPRDKQNAEDIKAAAACLQIKDDCENWDDGLKEFLQSTLWPVALCENIYRPANDDRAPIRLQYTLKRLEPVNPILFCYRHAYLVGGVGLGTATDVQNAQIGNLTQNAAPGAAGVPWYSINLDDFEPFLRLWPIDDQGRIIYDASRAAKLDPSRHIVHRGHLLTSMKDNWGGPLRSVLPWWLLRGLGRDWFGRFMERYGSPFPVGKTNAEDEQAVFLLQQAFSQAMKIGGIVIDQNDFLELKEASVQGGADGHKTFQDVCNAAISRSIVGQDLSSSAKSTGLGSGVAKMQDNVREDIRMFDGAQLARTLERQVFANALKFNGLSGRIQCVFGGLSDEDAKTFADLLESLALAGWEPTDEAIPTLQERFGIPVQRKAAPAQPAGGDAETKLFSAPSVLAVRADSHLTDAIARKRATALAAAFKGRYAPIKDILLSARSANEALVAVRRNFPDLKPGKAADLLEEAMQIAAAAGAEVRAEK